MALQVWLPLNGDLHNQGLSNITVTNNGATVNTSGKIGSCYSFNGSNTSLKLSQSLFTNNTTEFSYACWVKASSTACGCLYSARTATNNTGLSIFINNSNNILFDAGNERWTKNYAISTDIWYHLAFVYKKGDKKYFYVNGNLVDSIASTGTMTTVGSIAFIGASQSSNTAVSANYLNGQLNDIRIYNHALSAKEVKEISQGLILHYQLNNNGLECENLILESHKVISGGNASGITRTYMPDGSMKIEAASGNSNYASAGFAKNSNDNVGSKLSVGDTYTISCDVKVESGTALPTLFINSGNSYKQLQGNIKQNKWIRAYYTSTWADPGTTYGNISLHLGFSGISGIYYFKNFKLEKSAIPTPWSPAPSDDCLSPNQSTSIYDSSGFNNNSSITGTININSISPKYNTFSSMNNTSSANHIESIKDIVLPIDGITATIWVKAAKSTNHVIFAFPQLEFGTLNSLGYLCLTSTSGFTLNNFVNNEWNFIAAVRQGSTYLLYINGIQETQNGASNYYLHNGNKLYLLNRNYNNNYAGNASISDFRIYATALSVDDILELYRTSKIVSGTIVSPHSLE